MYLNAFFGRESHSACMQLSRCDALTAKLSRANVAPSANHGILERHLLSENEFLDTNSIDTLKDYSIRIAALRAVKCKAIVYKFYEGCQQRLVGSGSQRFADSCPHLGTRLGDLHCNQVHQVGPSAAVETSDLGFGSLGKAKDHPRAQEERIRFHGRSH